MSITQAAGDLWAEREGFALEFCEAVCANRSCMPRKILRSPLQTIHWIVCLTLRSNPSMQLNEAKMAPHLGCHFHLAEREGFGLARPTRSVRVGSDCHWQSFTTDPFESLSIQTKQKQTPDGVCFYFGCRIGIRTPTNRVRVCRATVTQFGNVPRTHYSIASSPAFVKIFFKKIENFPSPFFRPVKKSKPPFTKMHKCGKMISY